MIQSLRSVYSTGLTPEKEDWLCWQSKFIYNSEFDISYELCQRLVALISVVYLPVYFSYFLKYF
jgi:hypothetical protein